MRGLYRKRRDRLVALRALLVAQGTTTASALAAALGVSVETVYRDMVEIRARGLRVTGEAGAGYKVKL